MWKEKSFVTNDTGSIRYLYGKKQKLMIHTIINSIWITNLNVNPKIISLKENVEYLCDLVQKF